MIGEAGPYIVQIELQIDPKSSLKKQRLVGLRIMPIDLETQKIISGH